MLLAASVLLVVARGSWEAHLRRGNQWTIIDLPTQPVWSPPPVPSYDTFRQELTQLPPDMPSDAVIVRVFRYDTAIGELIFFVAASAALCGLLYLLTRRGGRDALLHYALFIGIGFVSAAGACFGLWLLLGGWGPPSPLLFAFLGIAFGIYLGRKRWRRTIPARG
jgi:hypothetical protein